MTGVEVKGLGCVCIVYTAALINVFFSVSFSCVKSLKYLNYFSQILNLWQQTGLLLSHIEQFYHSGVY